MFYLDLLAEVHRRLEPRAYLEIGVAGGRSLALADCRAVGVDPMYHILSELDNDVALFRTTSDEYFSRPDPLAPTGGIPFDLAFIDGLHLFEFALRDFIFAERHASARGMIVFDDVLPRTVEEAARERHTKAWTGDVFRVLEVLARFRPDVIVIPIDTEPTGLLAVVGLNPMDTTLADRYDEILSEFRRPDPQDVPLDILDRSSVVQPHRFLATGIVDLLAGTAPEETSEALAGRLRTLISTTLGEGFLAERAPV